MYFTFFYLFCGHKYGWWVVSGSTQGLCQMPPHRSSQAPSGCPHRTLFCDLDKYILQLGQIHFAIWTYTFCRCQLPCYRLSQDPSTCPPYFLFHTNSPACWNLYWATFVSWKSSSRTGIFLECFREISELTVVMWSKVEKINEIKLNKNEGWFYILLLNWKESASNDGIILKYGKQRGARAELISIFRNSLETHFNVKIQVI